VTRGDAALASGLGASGICARPHLPRTSLGRWTRSRRSALCGTSTVGRRLWSIRMPVEFGVWRLEGNKSVPVPAIELRPLT
jgi:hypothetical protein